MNHDARLASEWANSLFKNPFVILDTETTGLNAGEIVEISIINPLGIQLLTAYVKPSIPIPPDATVIHGITDQMVAHEPNWSVIAPKVERILGGQRVIVYNASYDRRIMHQSDEASGRGYTNWATLAKWDCAMERYARFWGEYDDYHHSYRWQRLTTACEQQGIPEPAANAHSALGDCLRTLELLRVMAKAVEGESFDTRPMPAVTDEEVQP
jgi:DNA polymerase-3 subunit epsilon